MADFANSAACIELGIVQRTLKFLEPASWSSGNALVSGAGGLKIKSRTGQIEHSVANGSPPLLTFLQKELCCPGAMTRRWASQIRYTLRSNTASIMAD